MANGVTELNKDTFDAAIASGVALVDFWAPWCGPCKMQGPILEQIAPAFAGRATIAKFDVDSGRDIAVKYGIRSIPALLIFKNGELVERSVGAKPKPALAAMLDALL